MVDGAAGNGIAISDNPGAVSFGPIGISDTGASGIAVIGANGSINSFGAVEITNPGANGIDLTGADGAEIDLGLVDIEGLRATGTGLALSGGMADFTTGSLFINRDGGAGGTGIDLSGSQAGTKVTITHGGVINNVDTGVQLGTHGAGGATANATLNFNGGTIGGATAALDARGLNAASGTYAFGSTIFTGPQLFDPTNLVFVGATATGTGDGSSIDNLTTIDLADADLDANAIFVLVNRGTAIDDIDGFSLSDGQVLASFGNGRTFAQGGVPLNVTGDNVQHGETVSDAGGAATLTSSGGATTVTLGSGNLLADLAIANATGGIAAAGNGIAGVTVSGVALSGDTGLDLSNATGIVTLQHVDVDATADGIVIGNSAATVSLFSCD